LTTTKSGRFGNVEVAEYRTRITESEHTCTFKMPDAWLKRTPSPSCWTLVTGFIAAHCACAAPQHNRIKRNKRAVKKTGSGCFFIIVITGKIFDRHFATT
jgi:hypothetical protein